MRTMILATTIASGLLLGAALPASALSVQPLPLAGDAPPVTLVWGGCGPYAHPTPFGCRPNFRVYGAYRPYGYGYGYGYGRWHRGWRHW